MINRTIRTATAVAAVAAATAATGMASSTSAHASGPAQPGWVRLAHLSPNTPPVDVYLYPLGGTSAQIVLKHVAYGTASPYESLPQGLYTVAMRAAGAAATTPPVISTNVTVTAGDAYTVAGLGPATGLTLRVLTDRLDAPAGRADVRVIEASLQNPRVTVSAAGDTIAADLHFPTVTDYQTVAAGPWDVAVTSDAASTTSRVDLHTGSTYTLAILDGTGNTPRVLDLSDSTGSAVVPRGGVEAGFGGTAAKPAAPGPSSAELAWGGLLLAGATGAGFAARRMRRA